jgi:hypothetical protein
MAHNGPDSQKTFKSMYIAFGAALDVLVVAGMNVSAIDAAHSKHLHYKGTYFVAEGRDGNNRILMFACGIGPIEDSENYMEFGHTIKSVCSPAQQSWLNDPTHAMFSDRHKGLPSFTSMFGARSVPCARHLLQNTRTHVKRGSSKFADKDFWAVVKALDAEEYNNKLEALRCLSPEAAVYLEEQSEEWAYHRLANAGVTLFGHSTSNIVESDNWRKLPARRESPIQALDMFTAQLMTDISHRAKESAKWLENKELLTPFAQKQCVPSVSVSCGQTHSLHTQIRKEQGTCASQRRATVISNTCICHQQLGRDTTQAAYS